MPKKCSSTSSTSSYCVEPALILEQAAREFDDELIELRAAQERRLSRLLDECWLELRQELPAHEFGLAG